MRKKLVPLLLGVSVILNLVLIGLLIRGGVHRYTHEKEKQTFIDNCYWAWNRRQENQIPKDLPLKKCEGVFGFVKRNVGGPEQEIGCFESTVKDADRYPDVPDICLVFRDGTFELIYQLTEPGFHKG